MYDNEIFVFGSKIFPDVKQDAISSLPLELSWRIFSFLDDLSLRKACRVHKLWHRIILSDKRLRQRLNKFELVIRLGSEKMAKFYRKNRKRSKVGKRNFIPVQEKTVESILNTKMVKKRKGEDFIVYTKRFRIF
ncbi:hypothetical protein O0L34_g15524 [Tuta absoluta]|nr:hypothetical protein O0L34_g15524 [Tuta absoluta]